MSQSGSSQRWLQRHVNDHYVKNARRAGYRSRASFKLIEIDTKYQIFKKNICVVDLGAAPGSWSQVAAQKVGAQGRIIALDRLPMMPLTGITFIQGDFTETITHQKLANQLDHTLVDVVISDMAPNISGIRVSDQAKAMYLAELAMDFVLNALRPGGTFLVKAFHGEGFDAYLKTVRQAFKKTTICKPDASRSQSREVYLLGQGYQ